ncbi:Protein TRANSPARENT TESTA 12 [Morella rubra]|uniref:Protein TRANSPARENT TESTA 12 n=1 Tax=Morella rubra TaxID=262757 RepID=A0A6A1WE21_9ROSI|nr:Protein TRANSPARENT TESTA 12 [Morella rubra]
MLARVTQFGMFVVTQAFIGHLGEVDLAAYALIQIITVRFANGILLGMSSATETLCGQAFGAGHYHMMGIYLQRSWIINLVTATILLPVFVFSTPIFKLLGEEDEVAEVAGYISIWFIPVLYYFSFAFGIQKYLQTQLRNRIVGWLSALTFVLHVLLSWIFVSKLNYGIPGAMGAMNISYWSVLIGMFVYVFGGWCPNTWNGFSVAAFHDLLPVVKLSISSGVMLCLNIIAWEFMLFLGFLAAASVRVSNELGKGDAAAAKFSVKVITSTSVGLGVLAWILCFVFGNKIAYLFTSDEEVVEAVSNLTVLLSVSVFLNSIQPGLWIGMIIGVVMQVLVLGYITLKTDWDEQVKKASDHLKRWLLSPSDGAIESGAEEGLNG